MGTLWLPDTSAESSEDGFGGLYAAQYARSRPGGAPRRASSAVGKRRGWDTGCMCEWAWDVMRTSVMSGVSSRWAPKTPYAVRNRPSASSCMCAHGSVRFPVEASKRTGATVKLLYVAPLEAAGHNGGGERVRC